LVFWFLFVAAAVALNGKNKAERERNGTRQKISAVKLTLWLIESV